MSECTCHKNYVEDVLIPKVGVITDIREETPDVKTFRVNAPEGGKMFEHMPGQCAMLCAPGVSEGMFSITSSPTNKEFQEFSIKKCGMLTEYLHSLSVGDEIAIRGPYGNHFPVEDKLKGKDLLFIAGGIGLAPLRSVINYVFDNRDDYGKVDILYGSRSKDDLVALREIQEVWAKQKDTNVYLTIDREQEGWDGHVGFVPNYVKELGFTTDKTVVIITDTHIPELVAAPEVLKKAVKKVVIDHHRRAASIIRQPLLTYMEPSASSASELVTELVQYYGGDEEMNEIEASCLYAGIVVDTKNFAVQTSVRTFDAASFLRRCGADTKLVHRLFAEDIHFIKTKAEILAHMKLIDNYIAIAECPEGTEDSQVLAGQIADYLVTVKEIRTSFLFYHTDSGLCLSARSDGSINVQVVMEALGGGGHLTVAGCQLGKDGNKEAAEKVILTQVRKQVEEEKE